MKSTILIIEDDLDIQHLLSIALDSYGFHPIVASNGLSALQLFESSQPDLILMDVQLPDMSGFKICKKIRTTSDIPIIFVSCSADGSDIIQGLELGGDDYVTKPFDLHQLIARIKSNLRRAPIINRQIASSLQILEELTIGEMKINFHSQKVFINESHVYLSNKEFQILSILAQKPEKIFNAHDLYMMIWGTDSIGETRTLKVHISNLRRKLETHTGKSGIIKTVRGFGYQFCLENP